MQQWLILSVSVIDADYMVHLSGLFNAFMPFNSQLMKVHYVAPLLIGSNSFTLFIPVNI